VTFSQLVVLPKQKTDIKKQQIKKNNLFLDAIVNVTAASSV